MGGVGNSINSITGGLERAVGLRGPRIDTVGASPAEIEAGRMAQESYNQGAPLRQWFLDEGMGLLNGSRTAANLPGYATQIGLMERNVGDSFGQARDAILANAPMGNQGAITRSLGAAATGMAEQRGSLAQQIANQMMQNYIANAYQLATGGMQAGMAGMGNAANMWNTRGAANMQGENAAAALGAQRFGQLTGLGTNLANTFWGNNRPGSR